MRRSSMATIRIPLRSTRRTISPTRPRSTASGLQRNRVRDDIARTLSGRRPGAAGPRVAARGSGRADRVEGAGHDDLPVRGGDGERAVDRGGDVGDDLDPVGGGTEA